MPTFFDDFNLEREDDEPKNWTNKGQALAVFAISDVDVIEGLFSMRLQATSSSNLANPVVEMPTPFIDSRPYKGTIWMINTSEHREIATFSGSGAAGHQLVRLRFDDDGHFYYRDGGAWVDAGTYPDLVDIEFEIRHYLDDPDNPYYTFKVSDGGSFEVVETAEILTSQVLEVRYCGFTVNESARLVADLIQIGDLPETGQEGDVLVQVGPWIVGSELDNAVRDYNVLHELNEISEAYANVETEVANLVDAGDLMKVWIVPWDEDSFEEYFVGMIFDKIVTGPDTIRILGRDALATMENVEIDSYYFANVREDEPFDIEEGATASDPVFVDLPETYSEIHKPITRVQIGEYGGAEARPASISGLVANQTTISQANGYRWFASPFTLAAERWAYIKFKGDMAVSQTYTIKIVSARIDNGEPDLTDVIFQKTARTFIGVNRDYFINFDLDGDYNLNVGRKYFLVVGPDNPAVNYSFQFDRYDDSGSGPKVKTNAGAWRYNSGTSTWIESTPDETVRLEWELIPWKDALEGEDWNLIDAGANARIVFDGTNASRPEIVFISAINLQFKGARVFYSYGVEDLANIFTDIFNDVAMIDYDVTTGATYFEFADALETNALDFVQELAALYSWRIRQRHRSEGSGALDGPLVVVAEPLPALGSPVYDFKHGYDASSIHDEARVISDGIKRTSTDVSTMARISGKTSDDRLLLLVQQDPDLQADLNLLNSKQIPNLIFGLRKQRVLKVRNTNSTQDLQAIADAIQESEGSIQWKGEIDVDGASWLLPGDTITYQNSRRGLPETEFRVQAIQYQPHRMKLTLTATPQRLEYLLRDLSIRLGKFGTVQPLDLSTLQHTFFAYGEGTDDPGGYVIASSDHWVRLENSSGPVSYWRKAEAVDGPTINGQASKIVSCFLPPDDGFEGIGTADRVRVWTGVYGAILQEAVVYLDVLAYHWSSNSASICVLLYQT